MAGAASMVGSLAGIFQMLPALLNLTQIAFYIVSIVFFGWIAVLGYRSFLPKLKRLGLQIVLGAISMVCGISLSAFFQYNNILYQILWVDKLVGMLVTSIVLLISMRLMTQCIPYGPTLREHIKRLQEKLEKREDRNAKMPENRLRHPATIAGLVIFIGFIAFSLINFRGFPDMKQSIFSSLGISDSEMAKINEAMQQFLNSPFANLSAGCLSSLEEVQGKEGLREVTFEDAAIKSMVEAAAGEPVSEMYKLESGGRTLVIAAMSSGKRCFATPTEFCICS